MTDRSIETGERQGRGRNSGGDAVLERLRDLVGGEADDEVQAYHAAELVFVRGSLPDGLRAAASWLEGRPDFEARTLWLDSVPGGRDAPPQWVVHMVVETE
ncbi:MAG: hypothetical protein GEV03_16065 [Streptosporangiales bacterium]|nr:hypothetical protein [Streptosporangiales bacterium]